MASTLIKRKQLKLNIFNAPDGQYGCDENVADLQIGDSLELALDKLSCILDKLAPPKPPNLDTSFLTISFSGGPSLKQVSSGDVSFSDTFVNLPNSLYVVSGEDLTDITWTPSTNGAAGAWDADAGNFNFNLVQSSTDMDALFSDGSGDGVVANFDSTSITSLDQQASVTLTPFITDGSWATPSTNPGNDATNGNSPASSSPNAFTKSEITDDFDYHGPSPGIGPTLGAEGFWFAFKGNGKFEHSTMIGSSLVGSNNVSIKKLIAVALVGASAEAESRGLIRTSDEVLRGFGTDKSLNYNQVYSPFLEHSVTGISETSKNDGFVMEFDLGDAAPSANGFLPTAQQNYSVEQPRFVIGASGPSASRTPLLGPAAFTYSSVAVPAAGLQTDTIGTAPDIKMLNGVPGLKSGLSLDYFVNYDTVNIAKLYHITPNNGFGYNSKHSINTYNELEGLSVPISTSIDSENQPTNIISNMTGDNVTSFTSTFNTDISPTVPFVGNGIHSTSISTSSPSFFFGKFQFAGKSRDVFSNSAQDIAEWGTTFYWDHDAEINDSVTRRVVSPSIPGTWNGSYTTAAELFVGSVTNPITSTPPTGGAAGERFAENNASNFTHDSLATISGDGLRDMQRTNGKWVWPQVDYSEINEPTGPDYSAIPQTAGDFRSLYFYITFAEEFNVGSWKIDLTYSGGNISSDTPGNIGTGAGSDTATSGLRIFYAFTGVGGAAGGVTLLSGGGGTPVEGVWYDAQGTGYISPNAGGVGKWTQAGSPIQGMLKTPSGGLNQNNSGFSLNGATGAWVRIFISDPTIEITSVPTMTFA